jgi:hypothetical protein
MNQPLNKVERELVEEILKQNPNYCEALKDQVEHLTVSLRKPTGVGCYIHFSVPANKITDDNLNTHLGFDGNIILEGVPLGLGCEILVKNGQMFYIELFTYGNESWDGNLEKAQIVPNKKTK